MYYASGENKEFYKVAKAEYDAKVWDVLDEFRVVISRSRRLVSEAAYKNLCLLYEYVVRDLDREVSNIIKMDKPDIDQALIFSHRFSTEVSQKLDDDIDLIADEMDLKVKPKENLKRPDSQSTIH